MKTPDWHCADRGYRAPIEVTLSPGLDGPAPVAVGALLETGLERLGVAVPPDPASCVVVPPGGGGADARPAALFLSHSPHEPNHALAFEVRPGESGTFWLYFDVLGEDAVPSVATCSVGGGEPLVARDTPANAGFHSRAYPIRGPRTGGSTCWCRASPRAAPFCTTRAIPDRRRTGTWRRCGRSASMVSGSRSTMPCHSSGTPGRPCSWPCPGAAWWSGKWRAGKPARCWARRSRCRDSRRPWSPRWRSFRGKDAGI